MNTVAPLTLLLCIGLTSQAWAGLVMSNDARVADRNLNWTSNSATVVLTRFSCLHRPATASRSRIFSGLSSSHAGHRSGGGGGSSQSGGVGGGSPSSAAVPPTTLPFPPGIDDQRQNTVLPASASPFTAGIDDRVQQPLPPITPSFTPAFTPGVDDRVTRPFTPGIDDQVNLANGAPGSSTATPPTPLQTVETPLTTQTGPTTEQIVAELVNDPNVTNVGSSQSSPPPGADIIAAQAVPEPGSLGLLALGLFALVTGRRRAGRS